MEKKKKEKEKAVTVRSDLRNDMLLSSVRLSLSVVLQISWLSCLLCISISSSEIVTKLVGVLQIV